MFDEKYVLGSLCKRGHRYKGSEYSLRYKSGACVECHKMARYGYYDKNKEELAEKAKIYNKKFRKKVAQQRKEYRKRNIEKIKEREKAYRENNPDIVKASMKKYLKKALIEAESIAKIQQQDPKLKGLIDFDTNTFFLGRKCKKQGHTYKGTEYTLRNIKSQKCVECSRETDRKKYAKRKKVTDLARQKREEAAQIKKDKLHKLAIELSIDVTKYALGSLCVKAHDYKNTGYSLRYKAEGIKEGKCVVCVRKRSVIYTANHAEEKRQYVRQWREKNIELVREKARKKHFANREAILKKQKADFAKKRRAQIMAELIQLQNKLKDS